PRNPNRYLMSRSIAPATVTADDIMEYDLDSKPVDAKGRGSYKERFIHGEIYKVRPDVNAIIHSHSPTIVPFSVTKYPLKPILHNAAFLGGGPSIFDTRDVAGPTNLLVETPTLGKAIAQTLGKANIVLMRGHGDTVVGPNVRLATFWAIYAEVNARQLAQAIAIGGPITFIEGEEKSSPTTTTPQRTSARGRCGSARRCGRSDLPRALRLRKAAERSLPSALACGRRTTSVAPRHFFGPGMSCGCPGRRPTPSAAAGGPGATAAARNSRAPRRTSGRCR